MAGKLRRNPQRILQRTTEALGRASLTPELAPTTGPDDATLIARQAVTAGADLILVLGGDGTINEALNGMVHSKAALGILPAGTANVLAMELGLGSGLDRAIERLTACVERRVAVGGLCSGAARSAAFSRHGRRRPGREDRLRPESQVQGACAGKLAYWLAGFGHVRERVGQLEARINGEVYRCGFALASRVRNYGGDLEIASGASLLHDDFEIILFEGSNPLRYLWYMLGVGVKLVKKMPGVHAVRSGRIEMRGDVHVQIDGEYAGRLPASLRDRAGRADAAGASQLWITSPIRSSG